MANNFDSNFTEKLSRVFLEKFDSMRVLSKNVDTQLLSGAYNSESGDTVSFKRPTDYISQRTSDGDISGTTANSIITGKATGVIQDYITVEVDFNEADQAIKMGGLEKLLAPMATRIKTDLEVDFAAYMMKNCGLLAGTYGTAVSTWDHVAAAGAVMEATGVPMDNDWNYAVNPFTKTSLASNQRSLGAGGSAGDMISKAHRKAILTEDFAGMTVLSATTLGSYTSATTGDLVGAMSANPTVTYLGAKDTMTQSLAMENFGTFTGTIPAGTVIKITGRNRLNLSTRQPIVDAAGAKILFTATVTADASFTSGAGTLVVAGPGIFEAAGAFNTTETAIVDTDVVTILGADTTLYQPNMFWHKEAFSIGSVPIEKLYSTDTLATTEDGLQIRVSKGASIRENKQIVRFDLRPAFATLNPFFAGQGWGESV
jgi:hypothetical protein